MELSGQLHATATSPPGKSPLVAISEEARSENPGLDQYRLASSECVEIIRKN
jgi:hypothetical protein